jgi:uncharacterized protein (DUF2249 family)
MDDKLVTLDVREDIRSGREPFSRIMDAVARLRPDEKLVLIAPFEPVPLCGILAKKGFHHTSKPIESGAWEVRFTHEAQGAPLGTGLPETTHCACGCPAAGMAEIVEVDACGLEPPQPLVTILEALAALPPGAELRACTDRRPMHLYGQLEERGFTGTTEEEKNGSFITHIRRR